MYQGVGVGNDMCIISEFVLFFTCAFVFHVFCLFFWGFDLVFSLGVTTPPLTPVMGISRNLISEKECFDMLKSVGFGHLARLLFKFKTI